MQLKFCLRKLCRRAGSGRRLIIPYGKMKENYCTFLLIRDKIRITKSRQPAVPYFLQTLGWHQSVTEEQEGQKHYGNRNQNQY
ncbi:MAG TPA: hypothetical protein DCZ91_04530 [Lachnospiraceae bacterium]|nr:hypothetical protein [Lachnospiraceae bacterium]